MISFFDIYKIKTKQIPVEIVNFLTSLVDKGGPKPNEYNTFTEIVNNLNDDELDIFRDVIKESLNEQTLIGHRFVKPFEKNDLIEAIHALLFEF